jgi:hypothetical protein
MTRAPKCCSCWRESLLGCFKTNSRQITMEGIKMMKNETQYLERFAGVHIRQSPHQVRVNAASTKVQYDLCVRAVSFGCPRERVTFYDADLGVRGSMPSERRDFGQLVADVDLGRLGIIVAFDATRLVSNNSNNTNWHHFFNMYNICDMLARDLNRCFKTDRR